MQLMCIKDGLRCDGACGHPDCANRMACSPEIYAESAERSKQNDMPLYTHAAPADTERLAEALLRNWFNLLCHAGIDAREEKANSTLHRIMDIAKQVSSEIAKYENVAQAQPPAARVTDAMVNRLACWMIAQFGECRAPVDHKARIEWWGNQARSALEAALTTQENPNG